MSESIRNWVRSNYEPSDMREIVEHGCVSGCAPGLVYYNETVAFHDEHEEEIWYMLYEDAEQAGMTVVELLASFNGQKNVGSMDQLKNMLTWFAVEEICRELIEEAA